MNLIIYDILGKYRTISNVLYHYLCYLKKLTERGNCLYSSVTLILSYPFIINLKHNDFEQTNKIVLLFLKKLKNIMFCKDKCGLIMTFNNRYEVLCCTS